MIRNKDFEDLDEIELEDVDKFLTETLGLFNEFSRHKDEIPNRLKGVLITMEERMVALQDALKDDAWDGGAHLSGDIEDPIDLVQDVGSGNINLDFESLDFKWLESDQTKN
jgi:hypothetical protein